MDKPRNAEEQAFWDAAFIAIVAANDVGIEGGGRKLDSCEALADTMLTIRRKKTDAKA